MTEKEGEFKKRLIEVYHEAVGWQKMVPLKDIDDAKKEIFENIKLVASDKFHGLMIENDEKMIETLKKWFGDAENNTTTIPKGDE